MVYVAFLSADNGIDMGNPAHILVAEGKSSTRRSAMLNEAGYNCESVRVDSDLEKTVGRKRPNLLVLEADADCFARVRALKADPEAQLVPVMLVDVDSTPKTLGECYDSGVDDALEAGANDEEILARIRPLTRLSTMEAELRRRAATAETFGISVDSSLAIDLPTDEFRMLVVGVEEDEFKAMCPLLPGTGITFITEKDPYRARSRIKSDSSEQFDGALLFVDAGADKEKSLYFCHALRNDRRQFDLPLFVVSEPGAFADAAEAYREGASVVAPSPPDCNFVGAHLRMLLRGRELRRLMGRRIVTALGPETADELGEVYSGEFADAHLAKLLADTAERGTSSTAILFFIPTIGEVAALYGRESAAMLRHQVATWLASLMRVEDLVARVGADEFIALLPETSRLDSDIVRKRVIGVVHQSEFRLTDNMPVAIEVYVQSGIAAPKTGDTLESLVARTSDSLI